MVASCLSSNQLHDNCAHSNCAVTSSLLHYIARNSDEVFEPFLGVKNIRVYRPPLSGSKREDAIEFSVPFDSLSLEIVPEITEMSSAQKLRFPALYEQAIQFLKKQKGGGKLLESEDLDISRGYPGITLKLLLDMIDEEIRYYEWKRANKGKTPAKPKSKSKAATESEESSEEIEGPEDRPSWD